MKKPALRLVTVLAVLALVGAACGGGGNKTKTAQPTATTAAAGTPQTGGTLRVGLESDVSTLDPAKGLAQPADKDIGLSVYDPLMSYDKDGKVVPYLAKAFTPNADLTQWTMMLPTGVTFQDATPFNADAVKADFTRLKDPATHCACNDDMKHIVSVDTPDATTVVFKLDAPNVVFAALLAGSVGYVPSPTAVKNEGADFPLHPVGTGPFKVSEFQAGDHITVVKNPTYWKKDGDGRKLPYLDSIVFRFISDTHVRLQTLQTGGVDLIQTADTATVKQAEDAGLKVQKATGSSSTNIQFNVKRAPFDDVRVRKALAEAVNKQSVVDVVWSGTRIVSNSIFPLKSPYILKGVGDAPYNPTDAKKLIQEYGKPVSFTAECISASTESQQLMPLLQQMWTAVGAHVTLKFTDQGAFVTDKFGPKDYQASCFRTNQFVDPDDLYGTYHSGSGNNTVNLSDPKVDAALEAGRRTSDFAARKAAYDTLQRQLAADVPGFTLAYDLFGNIYSAKVNGLPLPAPDSLGALKMTTIWLSK